MADKTSTDTDLQGDHAGFSGASPASMRTALKIVLGMTLMFVAAQKYGDDLDFNQDIRPTLSGKCYCCLGPLHNSPHSSLRIP